MRPQRLALSEHPHPRSPLYLRLLGDFAFERFSVPVDVPIGAQRLLAFLALNARPVVRQRVAGTFWPDTSDERAMGNLRSALWRLNRPGAPVVVTSGDRLRLAPDVIVDFQALSAFARSVVDGCAIDDPIAEELVAATELLPDWSEDWVVVERERFRQLRLHALERLCGQLAEEGRFGRAVETCLVAVSAEPLRESAQRALLKVHLAEGNLVEAVRQYEAFRLLLLEELGVEPSSEMSEILGRSGINVPAPRATAPLERGGVPRPLDDRLGDGQ